MIEPFGPAWWPFVACFLAAYLIGSVPFGLIVTRLAGAGRSAAPCHRLAQGSCTTCLELVTAPC